MAVFHLFVGFFWDCLVVLPANDKAAICHSAPSPPVICSESETDTLIVFYRNVLNEVKNRIVTKAICHSERSEESHRNKSHLSF